MKDVATELAKITSGYLTFLSIMLVVVIILGGLGLSSLSGRVEALESTITGASRD